MTIRRRKALWALALMLAFVPAAALAERVPVYLPETARELSLTGMPDLPRLTGLPAADGEYTVTFSSPVEQVTVHLGDETEEAAVSGDGLSAVFQAEWAGRETGLTVRTGQMTVFFMPSGNIRYIELTEDRDYFLTGQAGASATIRWDNIVLETPEGQHQRWFVSSVTEKYLKTSYITAVTARFRADRAGTLTEYEIVYAPRAEETYTIRYSAADNFMSGLYQSGKTILRNGSGRYFWENTWFDTQTGRRTEKAGLSAFTSFTTPRVKRRPAQ